MIRCHGWIVIGYPVIYPGQSLDHTHSQTLVKRSLWRNFRTKTGNLQSKPNNSWRIVKVVTIHSLYVLFALTVDIKKTSAYKYAIYAYNVLNCSKVILCSLVSTLSLVTTLPDTWIVMAKGYYFLISLNAWIAISITQQITTLVADL